MKKLNLDVVVVVLLWLFLRRLSVGSHEFYSSELLYTNKLNVVYETDIFLQYSYLRLKSTVIE